MSASNFEVGVPVTPIRKLLRRLPSLTRKRRRRSSEAGDVGSNPSWSEQSPTRPTRSSSYATLCTHRSASSLDSDGHHSDRSDAPTPPPPPKRAQLAIQQYDPVHDAIVISTLPYYPFCCHQDLVTMTRPRLLQTAYLFNSCLPFSARFTDVEVSSNAHIRRRIEELVGIVVTDDIKAISESLLRCELATPPLATKLSRHSLEIVVEEDESDFLSYRRTLKKRRVARGQAEPSRVAYQ